jgi:hypothetical protein
MSVLALEAIVDHGLIHLPPDVKLPDRTRVYVIVSANLTQKKARLFSPRLTNPEQVRDFVMEASEECSDAYV